MAGWVARPEYREASVENLLTQASVTGTVAARGFAGGLTASSECQAVELGVSSGSGVAGTYGKRVGNLLDRLGL